jgi:hypothetical protein
LGRTAADAARPGATRAVRCFEALARDVSGLQIWTSGDNLIVDIFREEWSPVSTTRTMTRRSSPSWRRCGTISCQATCACSISFG